MTTSFVLCLFSLVLNTKKKALEPQRDDKKDTTSSTLRTFGENVTFFLLVLGEFCGFSVVETFSVGFFHSSFVVWHDWKYIHFDVSADLRLLDDSQRHPSLDPDGIKING